MLFCRFSVHRTTGSTSATRFLRFRILHSDWKWQMALFHLLQPMRMRVRQTNNIISSKKIVLLFTTTTFLGRLRMSSASASASKAMEETNKAASSSVANLWDGSDTSVFNSYTHPGYSKTSFITTNNENCSSCTTLGGWLAYQIDEKEPCWIRDEVSSKLTKFPIDKYNSSQHKPRILVLYGSLRPTSFSRKLAYEFARLLEELGCDVRVYNPKGLPVRDPELEQNEKVKELRALSLWSEGHVWVSPEMHGQITGVFKNQIDWLPLNTGSVRPTQGRTCLVAQVNGGSQSFNAVNTLRQLARWMRMPCCTNQSSVAKAWQEFDGDTGRMKPSSFRERVVDCAEEFAKFTIALTPIANDLTDRYSERKEKEEKGRLLSQAEKERLKTIEQSRKG